MLPNVSTLLSDLISPLFFAILAAPIVKTIESTAGRASGIEATAKAIEVDKTDVIDAMLNSPAWMIPTTRVKTTIPAETSINVLVNL